MASKLITATYPKFAGTIAGIKFTAGKATVDDATKTGKLVIAFATRQGWSVAGGPAAVPQTVADGKPVSEWTTAELKAYLDAQHVTYPADAPDADLRAVVLTAFETRAQGGAAGIPAAGHTQGTFPPEGGSVPGDDTAKTAQYQTPQTPIPPAPIAPTATTPASGTVADGATFTTSTEVTGTPAPSIQWQRQAKGVGSYADIEGANAAEYTTPALTVAANDQDRYRAVVSNAGGSISTTGGQVTVTA